MDPVSRAVARFAKAANKRDLDISEQTVREILQCAEVVVIPMKTAEMILERAGRAPVSPE